MSVSTYISDGCGHGRGAEGSALVFVSVEKFNHGVSSEVKKRKWSEITDQVNALGENHREVLTTHSVPSHPGLVVLKVIGGGATTGEGLPREGEGLPQRGAAD